VAGWATNAFKTKAAVAQRIAIWEVDMPTMSDNRRRRIIARQRKLENQKKRTIKAAKREERKA
jgi:hypothetical protein